MPSNKLTMPSISFFILGLVVATVKANETTTLWNTTDPDLHNSTTTTTSIITSIITSITKANTPSIYMNKKDTKSSTAVPATTVHPGFPDSDKETSSSHPDAKTEKATSTPSGSSASTKSNSKTTPKSSSKTAGTDSTGIIILIVLIIVITGFLIACYLVHKRRRRYSADISSRQDEANIPLSTVEPVGTAPQNGLTTFGSTETAAKEPEEPEAKPEAEAEAQEEQKAQTGSAGDPSAEAATPAPAPDSTEDKPKGDVAEQSPPAPVESTVEEKTDDEAAVSNKTSVESLKETNENNNANFSQKRNLIFWAEIPLDCSV